MPTIARSEMTREQRRADNQLRLERRIYYALNPKAALSKQGAWNRYLRSELYAARAQIWNMGIVMERIKDGTYSGRYSDRIPLPAWTAGEIERALETIIDRAGPIDRDNAHRCAEILALAFRAPRPRRDAHAPRSGT